MATKLLMTFHIILPILYAGILLGVSFIAIPIKFLAQSLTLPIALDVGKVTFYALIRLEWCLSLICLFIFYYRAFHKSDYILISIIFIILAIQTFYILPVLDERISLIQQNHSLEPSNLHLVYIIMDFIKIISLFNISYKGIQVVLGAK
jgi:hypothetical protein